MNQAATLMSDAGTDDRDGELLLRAIRASAAVQRRSQFFVWLTSYVYSLLPHDVATTATYDRGRGDLVFETFHSVPLPAPALRCLGMGDSALFRPVLADWSAGGAQCRIVESSQLLWRLAPDDQAALRQGNLAHWLVHGSHRPGRPGEIECFFAFAAARDRHWQPHHPPLLALMLPHLRQTYQRMVANESEVEPAGRAPLRTAPRLRVTERERQILDGVRGGMSNQAIGDKLGISPLTVKNHVQKILRKLGASNRAQAVSVAIGKNLLAPDAPHGSP